MPDDAEIWNELGEALIHIGDQDGARDAFCKSTNLQPGGSPSRYMYLGQMSDSTIALSYFEKGVSILRQERDAVNSQSGDRAELKQVWRDASQALACGLSAAAELFLTDLCDEDDAESRCECLATEAYELVRNFAECTATEPYVALASLRISQQRDDAA